MKLYTIRDTKALFYGNPFVAHNAGDATRSFQQAANDAQTTIYKNPSDFELVEIAEYDTQTGVITPQDHVSLGTADQYQTQKSA